MQNIVAWVRLAFTPKIGPRTFAKLIKQYKTPANVFENTFDIKRRYNLELQFPSLTEIEDSISACYDFGAKIILSSDIEYPELLKETEGYPPVLFAKGNISLLNKDKISIIGTRNSSIHGEKLTKQIATDVGKNGLIVVSGLARGIDAAAHYGSLETGTIGVIAGGINCIYPRENEKLQNALYEKGLVITENLINTIPVPKNFPRRNRIISGISRGVLVIEAMKNSGTMITANYALEQGRDVFAVPGFPLDPRAYGTNFLLKNGAILVRDAQDILKEFEYETKTNVELEEYLVNTNITEEFTIQNQILSKLSNVPTNIEELFIVSNLSTTDFNRALIELEILGKVLRQGNRISLI